jgi:hypothetical protein
MQVTYVSKAQVAYSFNCIIVVASSDEALRLKKL